MNLSDSYKYRPVISSVNKQTIIRLETINIFLNLQYRSILNLK